MTKCHSWSRIQVSTNGGGSVIPCEWQIWEPSHHQSFAVILICCVASEKTVICQKVPRLPCWSHLCGWNSCCMWFSARKQHTCWGVLCYFARNWDFSPANCPSQGMSASISLWTAHTYNQGTSQRFRVLCFTPWVSSVLLETISVSQALCYYFSRHFETSNNTSFLPHGA